MILQALTEYYQVLYRQGKIAAPGWSPVKVTFALCIGDDGGLEQVIDIQTEQARGKKTVPAPVKRSSGVAANFLCDNSSYILGVDNKGKPQRSRECFEACKALHEQILEYVDAKAAQAVLKFFRSWDPEAAWEHPALAEHLDDILSGRRGRTTTTPPAMDHRASAWSRESLAWWRASTPPSKTWPGPSPAARPWCPSTPRHSALTEKNRT